MATTYEVVLYGASGYTGKLTAWKLAERGIPFIAAGRNKERLQEEMSRVPELAGHDYQCVAVEHETNALAELFKGRKAVINIVGPFMQLGRPVVEASLAAGCHYFDTTGETDWMSSLKHTYGEAFARKIWHCAPPTRTCGPKAIWRPRSRWKPRASTRLRDLPRRFGSQRRVDDVVSADVHAAAVLPPQQRAGAMALGDAVSGPCAG